MDRRDQRLTAAGLLVAAAFVLSSCGEDEPTPRVENRPSAAETTPAAVEDETPEEFIRRWIQVQADMQNTGDTTEYLALSSECEQCTKTAERISSYYDAGGHVQLETETVRSVKSFRGSDVAFVVKTKSGRTAFQTSSEAAEQELPGGKASLLITLSGDPTAWRVSDVRWYVE